MPNKISFIAKQSDNIDELMKAVDEISQLIAKHVAKLQLGNVDNLLEERFQLLQKIFTLPQYQEKKELLPFLKKIVEEDKTQKAIIQTERDRLKGTLGNISQVKKYLTE